MTNNQPCSDKEIIEQFITEITKDWRQFAEQCGKFEIRCLGEHRTTITQIFTLEAVAEGVDFALQMNATKLNVYMMINPINPEAMIATGKGAKDTDILWAHYSFADADDEAGLAGIAELSHLCEPDIVVVTGTVPHERRHAYWGLSEACTDLELWRSTQSNIATLFATDSSVMNPSRIMRVAGTVSYPNTDKQKRGYISELVTMKEKANGCR